MRRSQFMKEKETLKYPIRYAIMEVKKIINSYPMLSSLRREYKTVAYIVSKCYVISEKKEYLRDGTSTTQYEVVFPYIKKESSYYDSFEKNIPEYDWLSKCINSVTVNQLFDSFEEALVLKEQLNEELINAEIGTIPFDNDFLENVKKIKAKHQLNIDSYKEIEKKIEKYQKKLKVTESASTNLEELLEKVLANTSLISSLSDNEKDTFKKLIKNQNLPS